VCQYSWHSAGFLDWPFSTLKYQYIFQIGKIIGKQFYQSALKELLWFKITKMLIAVQEKKLIVIYYNFPHTFVS